MLVNLKVPSIALDSVKQESCLGTRADGATFRFETVTCIISIQLLQFFWTTYVLLEGNLKKTSPEDSG